ncbi:MAG: AMP-binding protein, partial [Leucobacter sp.]|nr:AMP-binding protein [Leucobacter sp.]
MKLFSEEEQLLLKEEGWWSDVTWRSLLASAVARVPERTAVIDPFYRENVMPGEPRELTWAQLERASRAVATSLAAAGVTRGSVVGIQLPNVVELPTTMIAIARLGAGVCPFPVQNRRHELETMCT